MKKKIKDCSLAEFCGNDDFDNYPLLAIMRGYLYRGAYGYLCKNTQWNGIKKFFNKSFLNKKIEVHENDYDLELKEMIKKQNLGMPKKLQDLLFKSEGEINEKED